MAQPIRIEDPNVAYFITSRTVNSRILFNRNPAMEKKILGYLAKYQEKYGMQLFAFILMGNHYHLIARFPNSNKSRFMQAFNSRIAWIVGSSIEVIENKKIWSRRYSAEELARDSDIEHWAFYAWLNPVSSGLVEWIADFESYNSFSACAFDLQKEYEVVSWTHFNNHRRSNANVPMSKFITKHKLIYSRLPGYEDMTPEEYQRMLLSKLEKKRRKLVEHRMDREGGFPNLEKVRTTPVGAKPKKTKTGSRSIRRPRVLTLCAETRYAWLRHYAEILNSYKIASNAYLKGKLDAVFPPGTYRPPRLVPVFG